jgi:hypothetical protein
MVGGLMSVKVYDMIEESRYRASVKRLYSELQTVQILTLILRSEAKIEISKKRAKVTSDEPFLAKRSAIELRGVSTLEWDQKDRKTVTLQFFSDGHLSQKGILALCHAEEKKFIDLSAPLQIKMAKEYPSPKAFPPMKRPSQAKKDEINKPSIQAG